MRFATLVYVIYQNFNNRRSRVMFTILGVAVAIAVVLSLVSFGYGLQKSLLDRITTEESLLSLDILPSDSTIIRFDDRMLVSIANIPSVETVSPQAEFSGQMTFNNEVAEASINAIDPAFFTFDGRSPVGGSFFSDADKGKVVIGSNVPELFGLTAEEMIGKTIRLTAYFAEQDGDTSSTTPSFTSEFAIAGVTEAGTGAGAVYVNRRDFPTGNITNYSFAKVKVHDEEHLEEVRIGLINLGFIVSSLSDTVDQANKIFGAIQLALGIFGTFALVVAAIGLVNTMTISLLERTNEIGIMRAIGAAPSDIQKIFLGESVMIGFIGGLTGVVFGIIISELLNWVFNILASSLGGESVRLFFYPVWFIAFIMLLSTFVGFAGGIWPARRAASMNPLKALRYK